MKRVIIAFTSVFLSSVSIAQNQKDLIHETANVNSIEKLEAYNKHLQNSQQQLVFQENKGQVSDQNFHSRPDVLFSGQSYGIVFHLKNKGISYQLNRVDSYKEVKDERTGEMRSEIDQSTIYRIDINWLNTSSTTRVKKENAVAGFNNYYLEHCPNGALNVLSYENVFYENIYNGIDLKWYSNNGSLKYDYLVAAGADYQQIVFEIEGAESIVVNEKGQLVIKTPLGTIVEESPYVIQEGKELKSQWVINKNRIHFNIENIDASKPFVIDPVVRLWGTYYGGTGWDIPIACAVDASSNVYMSGQTNSSGGTLVATSGSHQISNGGGTYDAFLVKFNSGGIRQWGTYYGGTLEDTGESCAVDASGNVYMVGTTYSSSAIGTVGSHQSNFGGGSYDAYLAKFNSAGVRQWATYYGGSSSSNGNACALDANGNIYMVGRTGSAAGTDIATIGSHQETPGGGAGNTDAYLVKFNPAGVRQWGTYYGGSGQDLGQTCAVDAAGNVYLAGYAQSTVGTIIATVGSHQSIFGGGSYDAFLAKFNSDGVRQWGTYYGGVGSDRGNSCMVDAFGDVYLSGQTTSVGGINIATATSHQNTHGGGTWDAYLVKFNSAGIRQWGTYYGGVGSDYAFGPASIASDASGNIYLAGYTGTSTGTIIATLGSYQSTFGGTYDAFLVKFNPSGIRQWGTYYGSTNDENANSCAVDVFGSVYIAGSTGTPTSTIIANAGSHQSFFGGGTADGLLVKFSDCTTTTATDVQTACDSYTWIDGITYTSSTSIPTFTLTNAAGCDSVVTLNFTRLFPSSGTAVISSCNPITWIDGITYSSSNSTATHTLTNASGCDSIVTLNFTRLLPTSGTAVISSCNPITWIDGITYSSNNSTSTHTLTNAVGCDSIVTLNFTRLLPTSGTAVISSCNPITWIDGVTYSSNNSTATYTLTNASGCDSVVTLNYTRLIPTSGTATISSCDPITWIDGNMYSSSNSTATHTLTNAAGCDSIVNLNFTRLLPSAGTAAITSCNPITWINGVTYSTSNSTATHVLTNAAGCDSIVTLNFTRLLPSSSTSVISSCDPITWIDGNTYSTSNSSATHILTNAVGCDSIITLNYTRLLPSSSTSVISSCDPITWIDGNTYSTSNSIATHTLTNAAGCDSIVTLNFTRLMSNTGVATVNACNTYTWINGITYTSSTNTPTFTLTNAAGCDSVVTLNLTINSVSNLSTTLTGATISANNSSASYQWLDCNNSFVQIPGQTAQTFSPSVNGSYAVQLTENGCVDTSDCVAVTTVGVDENTFAETIKVYPNPNSGSVIIDFENNQTEVKIALYSVAGQLIKEELVLDMVSMSYEIDAPNGVYILRITNSNHQSANIRMIKE